MTQTGQAPSLGLSKGNLIYMRFTLIAKICSYLILAATAVFQVFAVLQTDTIGDSLFHIGALVVIFFIVIRSCARIPPGQPNSKSLTANLEADQRGR